jgi:hypothetical protein
MKIKSNKNFKLNIFKQKVPVVVVQFPSKEQPDVYEKEIIVCKKTIKINN